MRKINWKQKRWNKYLHNDLCVSAQVGCIRLHCFQYLYKWYGCVYCDVNGFQSKTGPYRKSLSKAKEDVVKMVCEMLYDFQVALDIEKKNFDL